MLVKVKTPVTLPVIPLPKVVNNEKNGNGSDGSTLIPPK
jgi:hypothetical protein